MAERAGQPPARYCRICGRRFEWRGKWRTEWPRVRKCSARCRAQRLGPQDRDLEAAITRLLQERSGTLCPSEAARTVAPEGWPELMDRARSAGRRLAARQEVVVMQRGRVVDPSTARGPVRLGRGARFSPG